MKVNIKNLKGEDTGNSLDLPEEIFGIEPNDHAIYLDVKHYLANQRQGSHKTKERAEIKGSTKKIKRQKGTGTARAGSIKSPIFRGGGRVFGPRPRDYGFKLNRKQKKLARKSALTYKARADKLTIVDKLELESHKTKAFLEVMESLSVNDKKALIIVDSINKNINLSSRNIPNAKVITSDKLNTYEIMKATYLVMSEKAVSQIEAMFDQKVTA